MTAHTINTQEWGKRQMTLPSENDFDPYGGDLDAQTAWKNFGNLTLSEAYAKFEQNPELYQEDFMFMGGKAFAFYYPVIERHLYESKALDEYYDCQAWILAHCIKQRYESKTVCYIEHLREDILKLIRYVLENKDKLATTEEDRNGIKFAWQELQVFINKKR